MNSKLKKHKLFGKVPLIHPLDLDAFYKEWREMLATSCEATDSHMAIQKIIEMLHAVLAVKKQVLIDANPISNRDFANLTKKQRMAIIRTTEPIDKKPKTSRKSRK